MIAWYEDCILFSFNNNDFIENIHTLNFQYYEELLVEKINNNLLAINYRWIDKVRIKDKLYSKEALEVSFWLFIKERIVCCFGNSESAISYAVDRLSKKTSTTMQKIDTFYIWKYKFYDLRQSENWIGELMSIHVKKVVPVNRVEIKKLFVGDLQAFEINDFFISNEITNLGFIDNKIPYYIDTNSVISFPSTTNENQIYQVIKSIVRELAKIL